MDDVNKHYRDTAVQHINNSLHGRNVLTMCTLQLVRLSYQLRPRSATLQGSRPAEEPDIGSGLLRIETDVSAPNGSGKIPASRNASIADQPSRMSTAQKYGTVAQKYKEDK